MAVTAPQFKVAKVQFKDVDDATVEAYLSMANRVADASWGEDQSDAVTAFACHLMTLDGLGNDAASRNWAKGLGEMQTIKSADLTLTRFQRTAAKSQYQDWLGQTPCGKQYAFMLRANRRGPRVAMASAGLAVSGYAKDPANAYGWPGVFNV